MIRNNPSRSGFTITELIIVVVVIGILSAILMTSYGNMSRKASVASLQADISHAIDQLAIDKFANNGTYPTSEGEVNDGKGFKLSDGTTITYKYKPTNNSYCVMAQNSYGDSYFSESNNTTVREGYCPLSFALAIGEATKNQRGESIIQDDEGNYVITGVNDTSGADDAIFIIKYSNDGNLIWEKNFKSAGNDFSYDIINTSDGGYMLTGGYSFAVIVVKLDKNGEIVWSKQFDSVASGTGRALTQITDGNYILVATTGNYGVSGDVIIYKFTSSGSLLWSKTWGGLQGDYPIDVSPTSDGGFIVGGDTLSFGGGSYDIFVAKYTSDGILSWDTVIGGTGADQIGGLIQSSDGSYVITGNTPALKDGFSFYDTFLIKLSSAGTLTWKTVNGYIRYDYGGDVIEADDASGYYVIGNANYIVNDYDVYVSKYTNDGTLSWIKSWGSAATDSVQDIIRTSDGGFAITGGTVLGVSNGEILFTKFLSDGTIENCDPAFCITPAVTTVTTTTSDTSPTASELSPALTAPNISLTLTSPGFTKTVLVAP